jgi:tRNA (mo5U34)-methyltransferase
MSPAELKSRVEAIRWYHTMTLAPEVRTPGRFDAERDLARYQLPARLDGKSVLDIGAWDGFFSFEAKRRGAQRVLATDSHEWLGKGWGSKAGFELAREALGLAVEDQAIDILDLDPKAVGQFDVVLFLGVLYHMRHPLLAIEKVASVTKEMAIIETVVEHLLPGVPGMAFYPSKELGLDSSNWWGPNEEAVHAMLEACGFRRVVTVSRRSRAHRAARAVKQRIVEGTPLLRGARQDRMVFHAWK